jgi:hypothetical protein
MAKLCITAAMTAAPVAMMAAPAAAAGPHPAPLCGALNMVESSPTFYPYAVSDGMDIAMGNLSPDMGETSTHGQSINGWNNMFLDVAVSGSSQSSACQ